MVTQLRCRSLREVRRLVAFPLGLAAVAGCRPTSAQVQVPAPVPFDTPLAQVIEQCRRAGDFVTDPGQIAPERQIVPGVIVTIYPRRGSNRNTLAVLHSGNIVAKLTNTGDQPFPALALEPNGESCWQIGTRREPPGYVMSRFVSTNPNVPPSERQLTILFEGDHPREKAEWRGAQRVGDGERRGAFWPDPPGAEFRFATLPLLQLEPWVTCASNGCCTTN